ncbi:MAG: TonB-dependent receptor [Zoogloeaceae bacterium]|jgi:vitamin B12 transporter|nr:TonB-dependent receptor [Zoogloeaceae bacterium]
MYPRLKPVLKPIAALLPLLFVAPLHAEDRLDPIVVTATRQPTRASEVLADVTVIDREEIENAGQDTLPELLARQPGIQVSGNGGPGTSRSIYLRGTNSNQTRVLIDGIPANSVSLAGFPLNYITLADVERIEILRGPASSLYGADAIGGVISIITRRGQPGLRADGFVGYGSHDTQQANAGVSGGNEHWRFRVEANHYQSDGFSARRDATNKDADDDAYRNTGGAASLSFLPAAGHEIGVSYRKNKGVSHHDGFPPSGDYDQRVRFENETWQIFSKNRILENWQSTLRYGEAEDRQDSYDSLDTWTFATPVDSISRFYTRNKHISWQNDITLPLGTALLAVERLKQKVGPGHDYTGAATYTDSPDSHNTSWLAGWTAHLDKHSWQINVRHDDHSEFGGKSTYGLSYGYQFTDVLRAHVGYGTSFKAPSAYQMYMDMGWGYHGNPDLKPEEGKNAEVGLTWERGAHLASATYYHNKIRKLIDWDVDTYKNVNKALLEGVTLAYAGQFGVWDLRANYDWLNADNQSRNAAGVGYERLGRRARNKASVALTHTWGALKSGVEVIGVGRRYDGTYLKTAASKEALGGYTLTNLTARYALTREVSLEARLNNIFDKKYETARYYSTDDGFNAFVGIRYTPSR